MALNRAYVGQINLFEVHYSAVRFYKCFPVLSFNYKCFAQTVSRIWYIILILMLEFKHTNRNNMRTNTDFILYEYSLQ